MFPAELNLKPAVLSGSHIALLLAGHVSFGDNSESNFSARELKNVHVDAVGRFLRLRFERNHVNKLNLFNQVCDTSVVTPVR